MTLGRAWKGPASAACALALLGAVPSGAAAATTSSEPHPAAARTFEGGAAGWTATVRQDGNGLTCSGLLHIPGVTCPVVSNSWQAGGGDGFLRTNVATTVGLLSTTTVDWTSPSFTVAAAPDLASLGYELRGSSGTLLDLGTATVGADLVDLGTRTTAPLARAAPPPLSSVFVGAGGSVSPALLQAGHSYAIRIRLTLPTPVGLAVSGAVELDDVALQLTDLAPPTDLSATVAADTVGVRVHGAVDSHGQPTTVTVDYGPTTAYGATTSAVVNGSGPQPWSLALAGLRPSTEYHYRVSARSADGALQSGDGSFTSPAAPAQDGAPMLIGSFTSQQRIAVFDLDASVTSAVVEVLDRDDGTVLSSFPDSDLDGSVTISMPTRPGVYRVRVRRTRSGGATASPTVEAVWDVDVVPPSVAGTLVIVSPYSSSERARTVTVLGRPLDAVSAQVRTLDADGRAVGATGALGSDGSAAVTLPETVGSYRVEIAFADAAGNSASVRSLPLQLTAPVTQPPDDGGGGGGGGTRTPDDSARGGGAGGGGGTDGMERANAVMPYPLAVATVRCAITPGSSVRPAAHAGICPGRRVIGRIAPLRRTVGGVRVTLRAQVPATIGGANTLAFAVGQRGGRLRAVRWTLNGRPLRGPTLRAAQLRSDGGRQTLTARLVPRAGRAVTVRVIFRTNAA
ncbi:hypothetical protein Q5424_06510 [Conexibacter sp. JD483]|uniref:hypothetical protein n=1 Tax=unclassified Conexibacter TaxID=2627773 RepID=UPI00271FA7FB|nr:MULTISPECIES: hypothetical protein [unclassified Conexibacter]MDO8184790.1 hypothetical protein [Conexibacter sp. CPCC 205706]MDO8196565.1 hypothetical protein [Conexibacter sp. CPCC 205762]MDR9368722.1 hypothetical protein [Conexibacter sp. JD483]